MADDQNNSINSGKKIPIKFAIISLPLGKNYPLLDSTIYSLLLIKKSVRRWL